MVAVPVVAPTVKVVAAPARFTVVAVALTKLKVVEGVVREVVISGEVVARVPLTVVVTPDLPIAKDVALVGPTFNAPAESTAIVPDVAVCMVRLPEVFVQLDVPPDAITNAPVELPMLVAEVPVALIFPVPVTVIPPVP